MRPNLPLLLAVVLSLACGDSDARSDASADTGPRDAGIDTDVVDSEGVDAPVDATPDTPGTSEVRGVVEYEDRAISRSGLGSATSVPLASVEVTLFDGAEPVATTTTDASGEFAFEREGTDVVVTAAGLVDAVDVRDFAGNVYAWEAPVEAGVADVSIALSRSSGAAAILVTLRNGLRFAREAFERATPFAGPATHWERGRQTPLGTSYAFGDELWILGGPRDTDEFDTPVLLHELGHYLAFEYESADTNDGDPHAGILTDPVLAWSEGWASFFSSAARGDGFYGDSVGDELVYDFDLASLPLMGEFVARPAEPMTQSLSEWVIAGTLFELYRTGDEPLQRLRSFRVVRDWLAPRRDDRGRAGIDYVDFLDGYLCLNPDDASALRSLAIERRRFPHDGAQACEKPFARRLGAFAPRGPAPPALPGRLWVDAVHGRTLRIISVAPQLAESTESRTH